MKKLGDGIRRHQAIAFFAFAYAITWPLLIVILLLLPQNMAAQGLLGSIAVFGPALAGLIVAGISHSGAKTRRRGARWCTFGVAWIVASFVLALFLWHVRGIALNLGVLSFAGILALLPAYVLSGAFSGIPSVRGFLGTLVKPSGGVLWYLIALLTFPVVQLVGAATTNFFGGSAGLDTEVYSTQGAIGAAAVTFLHGFFFAGGVNEETGWRGFALPCLQSRYCPLAAASIVWIFWALWHLPYDLASGDSAAQVLQNRIFFNFFWSILFAWVYNRSKGSTLAPALFHPAMNTSGDLLPRTDAATVLFVGLALFAIVYDRMWRKLPGDHAAVKREGETERLSDLTKRQAATPQICGDGSS